MATILHLPLEIKFQIIEWCRYSPSSSVKPFSNVFDPFIELFSPKHKAPLRLLVQLNSTFRQQAQDYLLTNKRWPIEFKADITKLLAYFGHLGIENIRTLDLRPSGWSHYLDRQAITTVQSCLETLTALKRVHISFGQPYCLLYWKGSRCAFGNPRFDASKKSVAAIEVLRRSSHPINVDISWEFNRCCWKHREFQDFMLRIIQLFREDWIHTNQRTCIVRAKGVIGSQRSDTNDEE